jgi:hypothetical protein
MKMNEQTHFQNRKNHDNFFNTMNYEPRTMNCEAKKRTQFHGLRFPLYNIEFAMYNAACLILKKTYAKKTIHH